MVDFLHFALAVFAVEEESPQMGLNFFLNIGSVLRSIFVFAHDLTSILFVDNTCSHENSYKKDT